MAIRDRGSTFSFHLILITTIVSEYTLIHPAEASNNLERHERFHLSKQPVRRFYFFWWLVW